MKRLAKFSAFSAVLLCCTFLSLGQAAADQCAVEAHSEVTQPHQLIEIRNHLDTVLTNTSDQNTKITVLAGTDALKLINNAYSKKPNLYQWPLLCYAKNLLLNPSAKALLVQHKGEPDFIWVPQNTSNLPSWYSNPVSLIANRGDIITLDASRIAKMTDDEPEQKPKPLEKKTKQSPKAQAANASCPTCKQARPKESASLSDFAVYAHDLQSLTHFKPNQHLQVWAQLNQSK